MTEQQQQQQNSSAWSRFKAGKFARGSLFLYRNKGTLAFGATFLYAAQQYFSLHLHQARQNYIHDKSYLYWKFYDGGIVEHRTSSTALGRLLAGGGSGSPDEPPRVMTLFEVVRTLNWVNSDERIKGIIADFSSTSIPQVASYSLGLAQVEEICETLASIRENKKKTPGCEDFRTIAFTDSFHSQLDYCLASAFGEVYTQRSGEVPFVGLSRTIPFYKRLLDWFGVKVQAEARKEYKSYVAPYTSEKLSDLQEANSSELIESLNENLCRIIAINRFPDEDPDIALEKVKKLAMNGPYSASEAEKAGLITGVSYKRHVLEPIFEVEHGGSSENHLKGFYHYWKSMSRLIERSNQPVLDIGVVYLMGTIGEQGDFSTASVVRGLKEAGEDDTIGAVVLRIDSGGGGVIESDTIHDAVKALKDKGKIVVASFGNYAASGGYYVATPADAIVAQPSTVTGSIGVAAMRPVVTQSFLDKVKLTLQSYFTGSSYYSIFKELKGEELDRYRRHVDEMYEDFKSRVMEGRGIHPELVDLVAGGRELTGWQAYGLNFPDEMMRKLARREEIQVSFESSPSSLSPSASSLSSSLSTDGNEGKEIEVDEKITIEVRSKDIDDKTETLTAKIKESDNGTTPSGSDSEKKDKGKDIIVLKDMTGPMGRGLVDCIGGIRAAATLACELWIQRAFTEMKAIYPDLTQQQILSELLPGVQEVTDASGLNLNLDINLKKFPEEKGFFRTLREAQRRGDAIDPQYILQSLPAFDTLKLIFASALVDVGSRIISQELDRTGLSSYNSSGLSDVVSSIGIGANRRKNWAKADIHPVNF